MLVVMPDAGHSGAAKRFLSLWEGCSCLGCTALWESVIFTREQQKNAAPRGESGRKYRYFSTIGAMVKPQIGE